MVAPNSARRATALVLAGLAAATTLSACGGTNTTSNAAVGTVNVNSQIQEFDASGRQTAPQLSGTTLAGKAYSTSYAGHVTVLNVWGSWCTACREEAPSFAEAATKYAGKGVQFLGIDTMDQVATAESYVSQFGVTYPSLQDPNETVLLELRNFIPSTDIPSTIIVDSSGKVAYRAFGSITEPELDQGLNYVLSGS